MKTCCVLLIFASVLASWAEGAQSPFLKEILQGRCYFQSPDGMNDPNTCPEAVGAIMSVLESHRSSDINSSDFYSYLSKADFSSPTDTSLFWLHFLGSYQGEDPFSLAGMNIPAGLMTPEDTPGGAMLKDLVFCGVDQKLENCKKEESNAFWSFWEAAYAEYAKQAKGKIQIVVEPLSDVAFLERSALSKLNSNLITEVLIYTDDCSSKQIADLTKAIPITTVSTYFTYTKAIPITTVSCKDSTGDFIDFLLCQDPTSDECKTVNNNDNDGGDTNEHDHDHIDHDHHHWKLLFFIGMGVLFYYCYYKAEKETSGYTDLPQTKTFNAQ